MWADGLTRASELMFTSCGQLASDLAERSNMTNRHTSVQEAIRSSLHVNQQLPLPSHICGTGNKGAPFTITDFDYQNLRLRVGRKQNPMRFAWDELEAVVPFIRGYGGEVMIGATKNTIYDIGTLDGYFKENLKVMRAPWGASILHMAGVVNIVCDSSPMKIRLRHTWR